MQFGIVYPNYAPYDDPSLTIASAQLAEDLGFDSFLVWDHYMLPGNNRTFEPWTTLAYLAARTSRIRLGTCVTPIPFRHPGHLAKIVASLDVFSGGRIILGVGAGWHRPEFTGFAEWDDGPTRAAKTREGLELILKLWSGREVSFGGRYYRARGAVVDPPPQQRPHPPLWFGTTGPYMLRLAAKWGQGWIPVHVSVHEFERGIQQLRRHKIPESFVLAYDADAETDTRRQIRAVGAYQSVGCNYYATCVSYRADRVLAEIRRIGQDVMASFR